MPGTTHSGGILVRGLNPLNWLLLMRSSSASTLSSSWGRSHPLKEAVCIRSLPTPMSSHTRVFASITARAVFHLACWHPSAASKVSQSLMALLLQLDSSLYLRCLPSGSGPGVQQSFKNLRQSVLEWLQAVQVLIDKRSFWDRCQTVVIESGCPEVEHETQPKKSIKLPGNTKIKGCCSVFYSSVTDYSYLCQHTWHVNVVLRQVCLSFCVIFPEVCSLSANTAVGSPLCAFNEWMTGSCGSCQLHWR